MLDRVSRERFFNVCENSLTSNKKCLLSVGQTKRSKICEQRLGESRLARSLRSPPRKCCLTMKIMVLPNPLVETRSNGKSRWKVHVYKHHPALPTQFQPHGTILGTLSERFNPPAIAFGKVTQPYST
jgi:hypothetical protein